MLNSQLLWILYVLAFVSSGIALLCHIIIYIIEINAKTGIISHIAIIGLGMASCFTVVLSLFKRLRKARTRHKKAQTKQLAPKIRQQGRKTPKKASTNKKGAY